MLSVTDVAAYGNIEHIIARWPKNCWAIEKRYVTEKRWVNKIKYSLCDRRPFGDRKSFDGRKTLGDR